MRGKERRKWEKERHGVRRGCGVGDSDFFCADHTFGLLGGAVAKEVNLRTHPARFC